MSGAAAKVAATKVAATHEADGGIKIDAITIPDRLRALREDGIAELIASFNEVGHLNPITVRPQKGGGYVLIAGLRRLEAAKRCGWKSIHCIVRRDLDADKAELAEIDENLMRAELSPAERAMHVERRKKLYEKAHPEIKHGGDRKSAEAKSSGQIGHLKRFIGHLKRFTKDAAQKTGQSERSIRRDAARGENVAVLPDIVGTSLDKGAELDALAKLPEPEQRKLAERAKADEKVSAKHAVKRLRRQQRERELGAKIAAMPDKKYGVIYADPPWKFESYSDETGMDRAAGNHYPTMDSAAVCKLEIPAADDCVLFLWATVPMLYDALQIMDAWDFTYKSNLVWVKNKIATGYWSRNQHEHLLIGVRGDNVPAPAPGDQPPSVIEAPVGKHSEKPAVFREQIEKMFPSLPKIELFARAKADGWDVWGNEAPDSAATSAPTRSTGNDVDTEESAEARRAFYTATEAMTNAATEAMTDSPAQAIAEDDGDLSIPKNLRRNGPAS
jgi:N6-adenosine-specific RNA methylase IME4/ParB-like chromosome segregation protein Spo0J